VPHRQKGANPIIRIDSRIHGLIEITLIPINREESPPTQRSKKMLIATVPPASTLITPARAFPAALINDQLSRPSARPAAIRIPDSQTPSAGSTASSQQQVGSSKLPSSNNIDLQQQSNSISNPHQQATSKLQQQTSSSVIPATASKSGLLQTGYARKPERIEGYLRNGECSNGGVLSLGSRTRRREALYSFDRYYPTRGAWLSHLGRHALARSARVVPIAVPAISGVMG